MKYLLILLSSFPLYALAQSPVADSIITKSSLQQTVSFLSADSLKGRLTGSEGAKEAAKFITSCFISSGLVPGAGNTTYADSFATYHYNKKHKGVNVIGLLPALTANDTIVIFSAHYDHIGQGNDLESNKDYRSDDAIYNGANDNATGVAALLELAKYFSHQKSNRYNLLFIAFAGEEMGLVGSTAYVKKMNTALVKTVINIEMLGRPAYKNCYIITLGNNKIRALLNNNLEKAGGSAEKPFFVSDPFYEDELAYRSDHYPFAKKIKNAFTIMASSPTDIYYHSVDDEYETIDFDFLVEATRNIALACENFTK